jgi:hypothetical protein
VFYWQISNGKNLDNILLCQEDKAEHLEGIFTANSHK